MNVVCPRCGYAFVSAEGVPACPRCTYQFSSLLKDIGIKKKSERPTIAGVLLTIVAVFGLLIAPFIYSVPSFLDWTPEFSAEVYACATISVIFSVFTLLGGVFAFKRKHFGVCVVGAVLGLISPVLGIGTILSAVALIFLALSRAEFK